jgi:hypothetical protein
MLSASTTGEGERDPMKNITVMATAGLFVAALVGCAPTTEKASTETAPATPTVWTGSPAPAGSEGHGGGDREGMGGRGEASDAAAGEAPTRAADLHSYIVDNKIAETPFQPDQPGTPIIDFPIPADWNVAGDRKPDWAYGAIVYGKPTDPEDPPFMYAIASKLTGNVDPAKILELAPGQLDELPEFKPVQGPPKRSKLSGYDSIDYVGTFVWEGKSRSVGQQTIVIPGKDGFFVLQLNGEAPKGQEQIVIDAARTIREKTAITLPS